MRMRSSVEWSRLWRRERAGASVNGGWMWAWISDAGQVKRTDKKGAELASQRKMSSCVSQSLFLVREKSARSAL
jgi:hypothetical protein